MYLPLKIIQKSPTLPNIFLKGGECGLSKEKSNFGKTLVFIILGLVFIYIVIYFSGLLSLKCAQRDLFTQNYAIKDLKLFCIEKNELAIETYCRLLRNGATPVDSKEKADLIVSIKKEILYISSSTGASYLNLPIGDKYIQDTQNKYLEYFNKTLTELEKLKAPKK